VFLWVFGVVFCCFCEGVVCQNLGLGVWLLFFRGGGCKTIGLWGGVFFNGFVAFVHSLTHKNLKFWFFGGPKRLVFCVCLGCGSNLFVVS